MENLAIKECPGCGKEWGPEEVSFQTCDECGYPLKVVHKKSEYDAELDDDIHD